MFFLGRTIEVEEELFKRKGEEKEKSVEEVVVLENFLLLLKINIQITSTVERKNCAHTQEKSISKEWFLVASLIGGNQLTFCMHSAPWK